MRYLFIGLIRFYRRFISPLFPAVCRYRPSCSQYGLDALRRYGSFRGIWLTMLRIFRCNPFSDGGWDPVPLKFDILGRHHGNCPPDPLFHTVEGICERYGITLSPRQKWRSGSAFSSQTDRPA